MRKGRAVLGVWIALTSIAAVACSQSASSACDCTDNDVRIHVPADLAAAVMTPTLSRTCASITPTCTQAGSVGGCETYQFAPQASGECDITVEFSNGKTFAATLSISESTGCCAGFHTDPLSAADVEIPEGT